MSTVYGQGHFHSLELLLDVHFPVQCLDDCHVFLLLAPVVCCDHSALLLTGQLQCCADEPRALVVLDVCAHLANDFRVTIAVQVVILDLQGQAETGGLTYGPAETTSLVSYA